MDGSYPRRNDAERQRLRDLVGRLSDADLATDLGDGWTVAVMLAHMAFWDRAAVVLLERWPQDGFRPAPWYEDALRLNEAVSAGWRLIPPRTAAAEALAAAEAADAQAARAVEWPTDLAEAVRAGGWLAILERNRHRREHLEQIERALGR